MGRPRDPAKERALLDAAAQCIGRDGLGAPTADIARDAGVAYGTLFAIFGNKAGLLSGTYLHLQGRLAYVARAATRRADTPRTNLQRLWHATLTWADANPEQWRALTTLDGSADVTPDARAQALRLAQPVLDVLARAQQHGPLQDAPPAFTFSLMRAMISSTHQHADRTLEQLGFDAFWSALSPHGERITGPERPAYFTPD